MSPSKLSVFANLALAASAVLLPPTITADDLGDDNSLETLAINPFKRSVALECPGCASATLESDSLKWTQGTGNHFLLDFEVDANEDTLNIDGNKLYPPSFSYQAPKFYVTQVHPDAQTSGAEDVRLAVTGYSLHFSSAETVSEAGTELLPLTFQILAIESMPVAPPALVINVLKDANGRLMIASFETEQATGALPVVTEKECRQWPLLCKWRGILADQIEQVKSTGKGKPCHKRPHGPGQDHGRPNPMAEETTEGKPPHRFRPGHPHPHHRPHHMDHDGHGHHRSHHRMQMFLHRAFFVVLVPILVGIFAGTLTYLVGMALGCVIAIVIARTKGQSYQRIALEEEDVEEAEYRDEKEYIAELPAYESPPVYEEQTEKEVDEESK
ncbi:hypothetical protein P153DRAFT_380592 [Dothidotthia symphoricarpi CBS 119687]|uniref:DUF7728 domain-containing protein n=1 Tax=Dothidotthia symphoricarpi CBS 119687 TaxID=1392245 RepID=A0A6A6AW70_9PLEO|nr:uncharacterized protein P153DRAFT_380592 [Dothidotthia symphoricarpi CBS 119687]KAF2134781.1 hypothetical protein P153DRAFT_380592 [Dothidotthia symphoricarpi CBS 119687]